jgi:hypothetical protein
MQKGREMRRRTLIGVLTLIGVGDFLGPLSFAKTSQGPLAAAAADLPPASKTEVGL